MQTLQTYMTALLPVLGIVIGASLQYYFSKSGEKRKQLETLRSQAFVGYLRAVAQIGHLEKADLKKRDELHSVIADAKARICIYGPASLIKVLADFEKSDRLLNSPQTQTSFLKVCIEMRKQHFGNADEAQGDDLGLILFGLKDQ